ncbi:MAG: endonuclease V [Halobacteriaceae archaeon]
MDLERPAFAPDPSLSDAEMKALQRDIARSAAFTDHLSFAPDDVTLAETLALDAAQSGFGDGPVVAGVDQAFLPDEEVAVSAVVAIRDGRVVERAVGRAPLEIPYIPGLLAFREAGAIFDGVRALDVDPDLLVLDGSGRIHYRQAGIATHVGVAFDCPAVGVAKNLLCGEPRASLSEPLPEGARVPIEADDEVEAVSTAGEWPVVGHAYQSRQYDDPTSRHVNPLYVSPGHRVSAATTVELVGALAAGYKLPEPTRLADAHADAVTTRERQD